MLNLYLQYMSKQIKKEFQCFLQDFDIRVVQHERGNTGISTGGGDHRGKKALYDSTILWCKENRFLRNESTKRSNQNVTVSLSFWPFSPVFRWCKCLLNAQNVNVNVVLLLYWTNKTQSGEYCENVPLHLLIQILHLKKLLHPKDHKRNMLKGFTVF